MARVVMAGGGTGGHVVPLIAVAKELVRKGHEVLFIGTRQGIEARLVPEAGYPIEWIEIGGLQRVGLARRVRTAWQLPASVVRVMGIFRRWRPAAVFSLGGYAAGPVAMAALLLRVRIVAMEPNAVPGFTARVTARWTWRALLAFEETADYFPERRSVVTGLPVREEFFALPERDPADKFTVLITGGSRGSRTLNRAFRECLPKLAGVAVRVIHQSGAAEKAACEEVLRASGVEGEVHDYIADMPAAFGRADLVVCRSGAGAVAEAAAAGKPSLLVPFPFAAGDHQARNADAMARAGAARIIEDANLTGARLAEEVLGLAEDRGALERMAAAARRMAKRGGAVRAAEIVEEAIDLGLGKGNNNR